SVDQAVASSSSVARPTWPGSSTLLSPYGSYEATPFRTTGPEDGVPPPAVRRGESLSFDRMTAAAAAAARPSTSRRARIHRHPPRPPGPAPPGRAPRLDDGQDAGGAGVLARPKAGQAGLELLLERRHRRKARGRVLGEGPFDGSLDPRRYLRPLEADGGRRRV